MKLHHEPAVLVLTRQDLPTLDRDQVRLGRRAGQGRLRPGRRRRTASPRSSCWPPAARCSLCVDAYEKLKAEGIKARVVSMPSWELFEHQDQAYRDSVLPPDVTARVSVEQASTFGWERYVGRTGTRIGMRTFGASAPAEGTADEVRLHPRQDRRRGQGAD